MNSVAPKTSTIKEMDFSRLLKKILVFRFFSCIDRRGELFGP
jgi:hypothetical protein